MKTSLLNQLQVILCAIILVGCGGGGTDTTGPVTTPPVGTNPQPVVLNVTALDGYLQNAHVYIDLNENYQFDETEPSAMTDANGQVSFTVTDIAEGLIKPIIVEAVAGQTIDLSTGLSVAQSYTMVAPPASEVVSPLTTLAQLNFVHGQFSDIDSAISEVKTQLGLSQDSNLMADYLASGSADETLYAIARALVTQLPQDPSTLFDGSANPQAYETLMSRANSIATAVQQAISAGAQPRSIFITINEDGTVTANELTIEDAMAFINDVQVWSDAFNFEFVQASSEFAHQVEAAAQLAQADTSELFNMLARYAEGGLVSIKANLYREWDASLFVAGSSGTVTTVKDAQSGVESIVIDAQLDDKSVVATISLSSEQTNTAGLTAMLDSNTVTIQIHQGSELVLDSETYFPLKLALSTTIDTKSDTEALHFVGNALIDTLSLTTSTGENVVGLSQVALSGLFQIDQSQSFNAAMNIELHSSLQDDQLHIELLLVSVTLDATFTGVPNAYITIQANLGDSSSALVMQLGYGDRYIILTLSGNVDDAQLVLTNAMGMTLTLNLAVPQNAQDRGVLVMGAEPIASVDKVDGHYVLTFSDGTTLTLF